MVKAIKEKMSRLLFMLLRSVFVIRNIDGSREAAETRKALPVTYPKHIYKTGTTITNDLDRQTSMRLSESDIQLLLAPSSRVPSPLYDFSVNSKETRDTRYLLRRH